MGKLHETELFKDPTRLNLFGGVKVFIQNEEYLDRFAWKPIYDAEFIILSVISLLNAPNVDSPANMEAAFQFRDRFDLYSKTVKKFT